MEGRKWHLLAGFGIIFLVYTLKLLHLQVLSDDYKAKAEANIIERVIEYPQRGMIFDRNGKLIVSNSAVFDVMVTPKQLKLTDADSMELCRIFDLEREELREKLKSAKRYSPFKPTLFAKQLNTTEFAHIQDQLVKYPGLTVVPRTVREYLYPTMPHVLGYVKEVSKKFLEQDTTGYYNQGDLAGISGLERYYEKELRGRKGISYVMKNVRGVVKGRFMEGSFDTIPLVGTNLTSTIDLDLQLYGEKLMQGKRGAIVAIEPSTGEVLAMISSPYYDPGMLTGEGKRVSRNYVSLAKDPDKPLLNRAMQSSYPPGSTFKTVMMLIGLQEGALDTLRTSFPCSGERVGCHAHASPLNTAGAIQHSCNPWFYKAFRRILNQENGYNSSLKPNLDKWNEYVKAFGLGRKLELDLPYEKGGLIPSAAYYDRAYNNRLWKISNIYSISIGQGEVLAFPAQLANVAAAIANRGHYYAPHLVKRIGDNGQPLERFKERKDIPIKREYFDHVARAMGQVVVAGTARRAMIPEIAVAGKTGTAQNPHGEDHSIFMSFAPVHNPKIAIAVYIENAGFGGTWAAPIASLMIEKYISREVKRTKLEEQIMKARILGTQGTIVYQ